MIMILTMMFLLKCLQHLFNTDKLAQISTNASTKRRGAKADRKILKNSKEDPKKDMLKSLNRQSKDRIIVYAVPYTLDTGETRSTMTLGNARFIERD